jgi:hypothetical protein
MSKKDDNNDIDLGRKLHRAMVNAETTKERKQTNKVAKWFVALVVIICLISYFLLINGGIP